MKERGGKGCEMKKREESVFHSLSGAEVDGPLVTGEFPSTSASKRTSTGVKDGNVTEV